MILFLGLSIAYTSFHSSLAATTQTESIDLSKVLINELQPKKSTFEEYCLEQCNFLYGNTECIYLSEKSLLEGGNINDIEGIQTFVKNISKSCPLDKYVRIEAKNIISDVKENAYCCYVPKPPNPVEQPVIPPSDPCEKYSCEKAIVNENAEPGESLLKCKDVSKKIKLIYGPGHTACCCNDGSETNVQQCKAQVDVYDDATGQKTGSKEESFLCNKSATECCEGGNQPCCSKKDQCKLDGCCGNWSYACPNKKSCCPGDTTCCGPSLIGEINICCPKDTECVQDSDGSVRCQQQDFLL